MGPFDYLQPETLEEALFLLKKYGDDARLIAGGTDVIPSIKKKSIKPGVLISLRRIPGLNEIREETGSLRIGALVTHSSIERSSVIKKRFTALADAVDVLGSCQIRNVGTIGGNICNAAPSADTATPLLVLGATLNLVSPGGERSIPIEKFFFGPGQTALCKDEILTQIVLPEPPPCSGSAYWKHARRLAMDLPTVGVSVFLSLEGLPPLDRFEHQDSFSPEQAIRRLEREGVVCREIRIGLGVVAPKPIRAFEAEKVLRGNPLAEKKLNQAAEVASQEAQPRDTFRGEAWYRREMIRVLLKRTLFKCIERVSRTHPESAQGP